VLEICHFSGSAEFLKMLWKDFLNEIWGSSSA